MSHEFETGGVFDRIKESNAADGAVRRAFIKTFGCQMNARDSETIAGMLVKMGYFLTGREEAADLIVYNTCCVRENAENRIFGNLGALRNLKRANPRLLIAVCGCMPQQDAALDRIKRENRHVDLVFGTFNLHRFPEMLLDIIESNGRAYDVWKSRDPAEFTRRAEPVRKSPYKSGVNIMYGCDNFCSYCIVPYVRGGERSRPSADILKEAEGLAADGVAEAMLLGQNVNSYGKGLGGNESFPGLLSRVAGINGLRRIRFMTSHPKDLSDGLIDVIASHENICKHIHLPMQSGSDRVLRLMNRGYTRGLYLGLINRIRERIPDCAITTDIIVGFPGETEEDFADTLDMVEKIRFDGVFTFQYSRRTGTPAAGLDGQVSRKTTGVRFRSLVDMINPILLEKNEKYVGRTALVMAEEGGKGRTDGNALVHFTGRAAPGAIVNVRVTGCKTFYLTGEI